MINKSRPRKTYRRRGLDYAKNPNGNDNDRFLALQPSNGYHLAYYDKEGKRSQKTDQATFQHRILKQLPNEMLGFLQ